MIIPIKQNHCEGKLVKMGLGGLVGDGGLLAILQGKPELAASDFTIV